MNSINKEKYVWFVFEYETAGNEIQIGIFSTEEKAVVSAEKCVRRITDADPDSFRQSDSNTWVIGSTVIVYIEKQILDKDLNDVGKGLKEGRFLKRG